MFGTWLSPSGDGFGKTTTKASRGIEQTKAAPPLPPSFKKKLSQELHKPTPSNGTFGSVLLAFFSLSGRFGRTTTHIDATRKYAQDTRRFSVSPFRPFFFCCFSHLLCPSLIHVHCPVVITFPPFENRLPTTHSKTPSQGNISS